MFRFDDIVTLANVGLAKATSHTLSPASAYILTRFKSEVDRLAKEYSQRYTALPKEVGIEDAEAFDARHKELSEKKKRTKEEEAEWNENLDKLVKLQGMRNALANDEAQVNVKPMPWEEWFKLKEENKALTVNIFDDKGKEVDKRELFEFVELVSEGILWKAPEE